MADEKKVTAKECRFAFHVESRGRDYPDLHLVKEVVHFDDGTTVPNVRLIENFKRPFYVSKPGCRGYTQKKECEDIENLIRYECTQSELRYKVACALGKPSSPLPVEKLAESPYLYGTDISSTSILKHLYRKQYPDVFTKYKNASFDIETWMFDDQGKPIENGDPIMISICMEGIIHLVVDKKFVKGYVDVEERYMACLRKYLHKELDKYQFKVEFEVADGPIEVIRSSVNKLHELCPDLVMIWNLGFDIPRLLDTLKKYDVRPEDIFCDPRIPKALRKVKYKKGSMKKITASGQVKPKAPSEQWHSLIAPAGFQFIDQMSGYRFLRLGEQEEPEYNLDYMLNKFLGTRKLGFEEADHIADGATWHRFMQANYPFEYMVYCNYDTIGSWEIDNITNDISMSAAALVEDSDFWRLDSQGKRFSDEYHFYLLEDEGCVIASVASKARGEQEAPEFLGDLTDDDEPNQDIIAAMERTDLALEEKIELKNEALSLRQWIVTLKSHLSGLGLKLIDEDMTLRTQFRLFVYDSDAVSAYPRAMAAANVSKETTVTEIIDIIDRDEEVFRRNGINLLSGHVNAAEYCHDMFKLPTLQESLSLFDDM